MPPMGGELGSSTSADLDAYVAAAIAAGIDSVHFYLEDGPVDPSVWAAIART